MHANTIASLIDLAGFTTGIALYLMLLRMVLTSRPRCNRLALLTSVLGLSLNAFGGYALFPSYFSRPAALLLAAVFSALCFLPAVVVGSALRVCHTLSQFRQY